MSKVNFKIGDIEIGLDTPLFVMAGPCVIEGETHCLDIANKLADIGAKSDVGMIFKASFDKANRSSLRSFRGPGLEKGLEILAAVRSQTNLPVMTDVHEPAQAVVAAEVVDCLQVPAFLCRQTDLLCACGRTGRPVNVKKGQFLSPAEMKNVVEKIRACDNEKIVLTERGTFFGYNRLVNDMTSIEIMKGLGCPVVFDATHSTQQPGGLGDASGGLREMAPILAKAAVAAGANGLFIEVHTEPEKAKSDAGSIMPIEWLEDLLKVCKEIFEIVRGQKSG
ncbi:MAG TPA: 3-deoxy-8-phosphooctulonate synthase [Sedimentisphaerales bacterium]|nr:3-deoxy-8-phosphooctulonate synthase [Sedimentisphaerales bacterium]